MQTICASMLCYRRYRLPESPLGWALFLVGCAFILAGSSDKLMAKVFFDDTLRKILRIACEAVGIIFFFASVVADHKAERY